MFMHLRIHPLIKEIIVPDVVKVTNTINTLMAVVGLDQVQNMGL